VNSLKPTATNPGAERRRPRPSYPTGVLLNACLTLALIALAPTPAQAQVGGAFCHGDVCPCGYTDPAAGCGNLGHDGDPASGALLDASGDADIVSDDLTLLVSGIAPGQVGVVFMGADTMDTPLGDGRLCIGNGGAGRARFSLRQADAGGSIVEAGLGAQSKAFLPTHLLRPGDTWYFQAWYRDPGHPCGAGHNLSNALSVTFIDAGAAGPLEAELAGRSLPVVPYFQFVAAVNETDTLKVALDPARYPSLAGVTGDLYLVEDRDLATWGVDTTLIDVRGAPQTYTVQGGNLASNRFAVDLGTLSGTSGAALGVGLDVVFDGNRDGQAGPGDLIDGLSDGPGVTIVRDTVAPGPHVVIETLYSGGSWLGQNTYYPRDIGSLGQVPLIVISHGNGHNYQWYDHIGYHLASYGYVVMSHQNETGPGIETASTTTLTNTDWFLGNLALIDGGILDGHIADQTIVWMGHSRGGEGIVRAYDRIHDGLYTPNNFTTSDVVLLSSIAPTVFFGKARTNPHEVDYHLWVGSADADVSGVPTSNTAQSYQILERSAGRRAAVTYQGVGHGSYHDGGGSTVATGPCQVGRTKTHKLMKGYLLPMLAYFLDGDLAGRDFLTRHFEELRPLGAPTIQPECLVVNMEFKEGPNSGKLVLDDFESESAPEISSSGGAVLSSVDNLHEGQLNDNNSTFTWNAADPMNGMTRGRDNDITTGVVFDWSAPAWIEWEVPADLADVTDMTWLSLRACQGTRHPMTIAELGDLTFAIELRDSSGSASSIDISAYGGGVEEPYQRTGEGSGSGWGNEFETLRLRLADFRNAQPALNLRSLAALRLVFATGANSTEGRLGLDDLEFTP
jgi:hypothetical protein